MMNATGEMSTELFLNALFDGCQANINLRAIDATRKLPTKEMFACRTVEALRFLERHRGDYNIYFGVATRNSSGTKEAIREIVTLHADVDFKTTPRDKALSLIASIPLWPTFIVETGGGFHVYWLLKEMEGKDAIPRVEAINRGLAKALGGDMGSCDASRILRLPGSFNRKPEYGEPRPVSVLEADPGRRYNLSDFADFEDTQIVPVQFQASKASEEINRITECAFIQHCDRDRATLPEIEWYCMVSNLARATGGPGKIHEFSKGHPKYTPAETNEKIIRALNDTGPHTCDFIRRHWDCGKQCGVKSPAALARKKMAATGETVETPGLEFPADVMTGLAGASARRPSPFVVLGGQAASITSVQTHALISGSQRKPSDFRNSLLLYDLAVMWPLSWSISCLMFFAESIEAISSILRDAGVAAVTDGGQTPSAASGSGSSGNGSSGPIALGVAPLPGETTISPWSVSNRRLRVNWSHLGKGFSFSITPK